jgi:hypothetical protein
LPRSHALAANNIPNQTGDFLNELFDETSRAPDAFIKTIDDAVAAGRTEAWLIDDRERTLLVDTLASIVLSHRKRSETCEEDWELLGFLAQYIKANQLVMSIPDLTLQQASSPAKYKLNGYQSLPLHANGHFNQPNLRRFIELLLTGAHFVAVHSPKDTRDQVDDLYADFGARFYSWTGKWTGAAAGAAIGHSHYGNALSNLRSAYAYPNRWSNLGLSADNRWPLVPILLVDATASKSGRNYNTFFQMEGWSTSLLGSFASRTAPLLGLNLARYALAAYFVPSLALPYAVVSTALDLGVLDWPSSRVAKGGIRHGADFDTHNASKWNISTYGACVYSEKRGTTVLLHGPRTSPRRSASTIMWPYHGAQKPDASFLV